MYFLDGVELAKICSKSVCRTQPELHTHLLLQYTNAKVAMVNISGDVAGRMFEREKSTSMVKMHFL